MTLGEKIIQRRTQMGLSQAELADLLEVNSAKVISNWENNINKPDIEKVAKICQVLQCPPEYFIETEDDKKSCQITEEEIGIIQQFRKLDDFGRSVVISNLNFQVERCENERVEFPNEIVLTTEPIRERIFLNKRDYDYEDMKNLMPKLKKLKKKSYLTCATLQTFLAYRGYNGMICIADLLMVFNGVKVPSRKLYDDLTKILEMSLTL